ncbi:MAG: hypothetical protein L0H64_05210 [Pseudonocardia sp.]|nr:hypothetical protein [Pseudonocardia sp.]
MRRDVLLVAEMIELAERTIALVEVRTVHTTASEQLPELVRMLRPVLATLRAEGTTGHVAG